MSSNIEAWINDDKAPRIIIVLKMDIVLIVALLVSIYYLQYLTT